MGAAMLFNNLSLDVFGREAKPNEAVSDEYTFCGGGSSKPDAEITDASPLRIKQSLMEMKSPGTDPDPGFAVRHLLPQMYVMMEKSHQKNLRLTTLDQPITTGTDTTYG